MEVWGDHLQVPQLPYTLLQGPRDHGSLQGCPFASGTHPDAVEAGISSGDAG